MPSGGSGINVAEAKTATVIQIPPEEMLVAVAYQYPQLHQLETKG